MMPPPLPALRLASPASVPVADRVAEAVAVAAVVVQGIVGTEALEALEPVRAVRDAVTALLISRLCRPLLPRP